MLLEVGRGKWNRERVDLDGRDENLLGEDLASTTRQGGAFEPEVVTQHWDVLSQRIEKLVGAWERGSDAPRLETFLPAEPAMLRRLVLVELIKVDLEYRWQHRKLPKKIEDYLEQFPELREGGVPADLIYEEFHVRRCAGETVDMSDYYERFPQQAVELGRLLGLDAEPRSTVLASREPLQRVEVGATIDDFDLLTRLGEGAFAAVYLARQRSMQRLVAVKISSDRGNEPQTMAQLDHPHIVRIYDQRLLPERNLRLLYMQYIAGGTLQAVVQHMRQVPPSERHGRTLLEVIDRCLIERGESAPTDSQTRHRLADADWPTVVCWLGARLASALDYAHRRGVLHRDIKPANVLLAADGMPKLVDFNVSFSSKLEGSTPAAYFGGSLAYMSPEQLEACNAAHERQPDELDGRTDLYSLGIMLWELLTGRRPFEDDQPSANWTTTLGQLTARRRSGVGAAARAQLPRNCPPGLDQVLLTCLSPEVEQRFSTGAEFSRQLELCLKPTVQRLMRPSAHDWRQRVRRHPLASLTLAAVVANIVVSLPNIHYNETAIVKSMQSVKALDVFKLQLLTINPIVYGIGILFCSYLAWPTVRTVSRLQRNQPVESNELAAARRRCLRLGEFVAWTSLVLWLAAGALFTGWLRIVEPALGLAEFRHFMLSTVVWRVGCDEHVLFNRLRYGQCHVSADGSSRFGRWQRLARTHSARAAGHDLFCYRVGRAILGRTGVGVDRQSVSARVWCPERVWAHCFGRFILATARTGGRDRHAIDCGRQRRGRRSHDTHDRHHGFVLDSIASLIAGRGHPHNGHLPHGVPPRHNRHGRIDRTNSVDRFNA